MLGFVVKKRKKRAWDFELFAPQNFQIHVHKLEFVSKIGQLFTLDPVETQVEVSVHLSGVSVPGVTLLSRQAHRLLMYCKSTRAVLRGEEMFSCDFIVIFIFSKLLLWILILSTWGAIKNVFLFFFLFFSCYVIQKLL